MWWFDTTGDGYYDSDLRKTADGYIYLMSGNAYHTGAIQQYQSLEQMNSIAESIASGTASGIAQYTMGTTYEHGNEQYYHQYASDSGATIETMGQEQEEFFGEQDPTTPIGEVGGYGMPAQTSESLLGMDEASQWGGECFEVNKIEDTDIEYPTDYVWDMDISEEENFKNDPAIHDEDYE